MLEPELLTQPQSPMDKIRSCRRLLEDTFGSELKENGWNLIIEPTINELTVHGDTEPSSAPLQSPTYLYAMVVSIVHPASAIPEHLETVADVMRAYIAREGGFNLDIDPYGNVHNTLNAFTVADGPFARYRYSMLSLFGQSDTPPAQLRETF